MMYFQTVKQLLFILLLLCSTLAYAQPQAVEVRYLKDYYYTGEATIIPKKKEMAFFVLSSRKDFKKIFGATNRPDTADFSKEVMLVVIMKQTRRNAKVTVNKICTKAGGFIEAYCNIDEGRHQMTYDTWPLCVCVIPRYPGVNKVNFYNEHKMRPLATLPIK